MSLADLLNQSTVIYPGTTDGYMRKMDADRNLKALAPDMARLLIDMAALVVDQGKFIDFDATPNLSERYGALVARFADLNADLATFRNPTSREAAADRVETELARLDKIVTLETERAVKADAELFQARRELARLREAESQARYYREKYEERAEELQIELARLREALDNGDNLLSQAGRQLETAEREVARLQEGLRRIEHWPVDVNVTPESDLLCIKNEARALLAEDGAA